MPTPPLAPRSVIPVPEDPDDHSHGPPDEEVLHTFTTRVRYMVTIEGNPTWVENTLENSLVLGGNSIHIEPQGRITAQEITV